MHVDLAADLSALRSHGREELEADAEEETDEPVREREAEDVSVLPLSAKKEEVGLRRGVGSGAGRRRLQCHAKNRRPTLFCRQELDFAIRPIRDSNPCRRRERAVS
jgi:hypothetical protein